MEYNLETGTFNFNKEEMKLKTRAENGDRRVYPKLGKLMLQALEIYIKNIDKIPVEQGMEILDWYDQLKPFRDDMRFYA